MYRLEKKGARRTDGWKRRYFELRGSTLDYFEAEGGKHKGAIELGQDGILTAEPAQVRLEGNARESKNGISAMELEIRVAGRTYRLMCKEGPVVQDEWLAKLQQACYDGVGAQSDA